MTGKLTALGVSPGLDRASFVFGRSSNAVGITMSMAVNLLQPESIAQQHLDFIQKLYLEQSYLGEYFEQIDVGAMVSRESTESATRAQQSIVVLRELLAHWIAQDSLNLRIRSHSYVEIQAQKKQLFFLDPASGILAADTSRINDAFALWSLAFPAFSEFSLAEILKIYSSVSYEEVSLEVIKKYLSSYKSATLASFAQTKYADEQVERQRQYLIQLAGSSDSNKYELLLTRERLLDAMQLNSRKLAVREPKAERSRSQQYLATTAVAAEQGLDVAVELQGPEPQPTRQPATEQVTQDATQYANGTVCESQRELSGEPPGRLTDQQRWSPELAVQESEFFTSPGLKLTRPETKKSENSVIWREPTSVSGRVEAWLFKIVLLLVIFSVLFIILQGGD